MVQPALHVGHDLTEGGGDLGEARDVMVIVIHRLKRGVTCELRQVDLNSFILRDRHLPFFELGGFLILYQGAQKKFSG